MLGQEQNTKPEELKTKLVDPGPEWGIKNKNSNEARASKAIALNEAEIYSKHFFFFNWLWAVKCEGVSAWVKDKELSGHSPPNQPWTPGECHDLTGTVRPACLASRPGA